MDSPLESPTRFRPRIPPLWSVVLTGPVVGMTYFWLVYLLAEAGCSEELELVGTTVQRITILAGAAAMVAVFVAVGWRARGVLLTETDRLDDQQAEDLRENRRFLASTGLMLLGMFALFALFLAAPAIGASLC